MKTYLTRAACRLASLLGLVLFLQACASDGVRGRSHGAAAERSGAATPTTSIEVQEDVGFTITEEARVSGDARLGYEEALALLERGELQRGIAILERLTADAPGLVAPRIDLGIALHRAGDLEAAEKLLDEALLLSPDHPIVHNELGILYRKTGRFDAARASYQRALDVFPGYHYARRNLAVLCDLYLGDLDCARDNYEAYMSTVLEDPQAEMWLADVRLRQGDTP